MEVLLTEIITYLEMWVTWPEVDNGYGRRLWEKFYDVEIYVRVEVSEKYCCEVILWWQTNFKLWQLQYERRVRRNIVSD